MAEKISDQLKGMGFSRKLDEFKKFIQHFGDEGYSHSGCFHESRSLECVRKLGDCYAVLVDKHFWYDTPRGSSGIGAAAQVFVIKREMMVVWEASPNRDPYSALNDRPNLAFDRIVKANRKDEHYVIRLRCSRKGTETTVRIPIPKKRGE